MIAFIDDHRQAYGVEPICKVLPIAPSTYHAHVAQRADPGKLPARARSDVALTAEIRRVHEANFHVYGVRKVWRQLAREGIKAARCTVARLMRAMELQGVVRGRKVRTTIPDPAAACPLDHVNRQFRAPRPNALWVSDITLTHSANSGGLGQGGEARHACFGPRPAVQPVHDSRDVHRGGRADLLQPGLSQADVAAPAHAERPHAL